MKKIFIALFLFALLISNINSPSSFSLNDYFKGEYFSYTANKLSEKSTYTGNLYVNHELPNTKVLGESMKILNSEPLIALNKLDAQVVKTEYLQTGASVIYAYSPKIKNTISAYNKNVNLQIAVYDDYYIIGWPLILGSF